MNLLLLASRVFMRLNRWRAAANLLARMRLSTMDATARGRLSYALLMYHRTNRAAAQRLLTRVLSTNGDIPAPLLLECATIATRVQDEQLTGSLLARALATASASQTSAPLAATDEPTREAARILLAYHNAIAGNVLHAAIADLIDAASIPSEGLLTLVPVSSRYLDLWSLWIEQTRKHINGTVVVLALDETTLQALSSERNVALIDARSFFAWRSPGILHECSRGVLWQVRTLILRDLLWRGRTVLILDLDAIAVADLQPLIDSLPHADIIAQEDHSIPMDVNRQLGFVLCCGFMLWKPTPVAQSLVIRFAAETLVELDDQLALNHILGGKGISGKSQMDGYMQFKSADVCFACPDPSLVSRTLHTGAVIRHFQQQGQTIPQLRRALGL